jgi:hypothetical protein
MPSTLQLQNSLTLMDCMPLDAQSRAKIETMFRCDQSASGWIWPLLKGAFTLVDVCQMTLCSTAEAERAERMSFHYIWLLLHDLIAHVNTHILNSFNFVMQIICVISCVLWFLQNWFEMTGDHVEAGFAVASYCMGIQLESTDANTLP